MIIWSMSGSQEANSFSNYCITLITSDFDNLQLLFSPLVYLVDIHSNHPFPTNPSKVRNETISSMYD